MAPRAARAMCDGLYAGDSGPSTAGQAPNQANSATMTPTPRIDVDSGTLFSEDVLSDGVAAVGSPPPPTSSSRTRE